MRELKIKPRVSRGVQPMAASAALLAAGVIRDMAIKRYVPRQRRRELGLLGRRPETHMARSLLFREKGLGTVPTIVVGGFVPDATETVEFQRSLLRRRGSIYYLNYPRNAFCREMFSAQLSDLIEGLADRGRKPVIFSVSFGCGLLLDVIGKMDASLREAIRGLVLVSPVLCTQDLVRQVPEKRGGVRLLEHNLRRILDADSNDSGQIDRLIERSRRCFQALFSGGAEQRTLGMRHLAIRQRVLDVIQETSATGGFQRVMALRDFSFPRVETPLFRGPVLTLLAELEEEMLVPSSPTLQLFRDQGLHSRLFPEGEVKTARSIDPSDGVPHASLIFHHQSYNALIETWCDRRFTPRLEMAV